MEPSKSNKILRQVSLAPKPIRSSNQKPNYTNKHPSQVHFRRYPCHNISISATKINGKTNRTNFYPHFCCAFFISFVTEFTTYLVSHE